MTHFSDANVSQYKNTKNFRSRWHKSDIHLSVWTWSNWWPHWETTCSVLTQNILSVVGIFALITARNNTISSDIAYYRKTLQKVSILLQPRLLFIIGDTTAWTSFLQSTAHRTMKFAGFTECVAYRTCGRWINKKAQLMLAYPRDAKTMEKNSSISKL